MKKNTKLFYLLIILTISTNVKILTEIKKTKAEQKKGFRGLPKKEASDSSANSEAESSDSSSENLPTTEKKDDKNNEETHAASNKKNDGDMLKKISDLDNQTSFSQGTYNLEMTEKIDSADDKIEEIHKNMQEVSTEMEGLYKEAEELVEGALSNYREKKVSFEGFNNKIKSYLFEISGQEHEAKIKNLTQEVKDWLEKFKNQNNNLDMVANEINALFDKFSNSITRQKGDLVYNVSAIIGEIDKIKNQSLAGIEESSTSEITEKIQELKSSAQDSLNKLKDEIKPSIKTNFEEIKQKENILKSKIRDIDETRAGIENKIANLATQKEKVASVKEKKLIESLETRGSETKPLNKIKKENDSQAQEKQNVTKDVKFFIGAILTFAKITAQGIKDFLFQSPTYFSEFKKTVKSLFEKAQNQIEKFYNSSKSESKSEEKKLPPIQKNLKK